MLVRKSQNVNKPIQIVKKPSLFWFSVASLFSMFLGSQVVHRIYRPLEDLEMLADVEYQKMLEERKISK